MSGQRYTVVCGLVGSFHVVDHFHQGNYDVIGKWIASFANGEEAKHLASQLNAEWAVVRKSVSDQCERCQNAARIKNERYCKACKKEVLVELRSSGYLTPAPTFTGQWSGCGRTGEMRENTSETRHGSGHG